jgi:uncharacterized MAPEG superfamily protein
MTTPTLLSPCVYPQLGFQSGMSRAAGDTDAVARDALAGDLDGAAVRARLAHENNRDVTRFLLDQ